MNTKTVAPAGYSCKGAWVMGSACGECARCLESLPEFLAEDGMPARRARAIIAADRALRPGAAPANTIQKADPIGTDSADLPRERADLTLPGQAPATQAATATNTDQQVIGEGGEHLFELWWAEYMPKDTQDRAWEAWTAAPKCDGVGVAAPQSPAAQPVAPAGDAAMPARPKVDDDALVKKFEAWASHPDRGGKLPIEKHKNGAYTDSRTYSAWYGWKSCAATVCTSPVDRKPTTNAQAWRPIETAPKDGTNILLLNDKGNMATGMWLEGICGNGWYLRGGNKPNYFFNGHRGPTHWMQLPKPPSIEQAHGIGGVKS